MAGTNKKSMAQLLDDWGTRPGEVNTSGRLATPAATNPRGGRKTTRKKRKVRPTGATPRGSRMSGGLLGEAIRLMQGRTKTVDSAVKRGK
jgi:hypothetical protein